MVGTSPKNPSKDEASFYELRFVPARWLACRARRQGSSMNSLRSPLTRSRRAEVAVSLKFA